MGTLDSTAADAAAYDLSAKSDKGNRMNPMASSKVAVLLCTYEGQAYLAEQLESFATQSYNNWQVWASDDGSRDKTSNILAAYQQTWPTGQLTILQGPSRGFVANFLSMVCNPDINADYYAYSDQDDIWNSDKLERAVRWLQDIPSDIPALYCSRTRLVDADNQEIGLSPLFSKPPSFANALIQNIGGGNTMLFNNAARALLIEAGQNISVITHDWWTYIAVTGCGGKVFYDPVPSLRYRQHGGNIIGMNATWGARLKRIQMLWRGHARDWNSNNIEALRTLEHRLTPRNREVFNCFNELRDASLINRFYLLKKSGVYRQTIFGNLGLILAVILKAI